jgi:hypothetical protein
MWGQALGALVTGLFAFAAANVVVGAPSRLRRRLMDDAQLLEKLPGDLPERAAFAEYVGESLSVYVDRQREPNVTLAKLRLRERIAFGGVVVSAAGVMLVVVVGVRNPDPSDLLNLTEGYVWVVLACFAAGLTSLTWLMRVEAQIRLRTLEQRVAAVRKFVRDNES